MKMRFIGLLVATTLLFLTEACMPRATGPAPESLVRTESHCGRTEMLFSAIMADGQRLPKVEISTMSREGLVNIGTTNQFGEACVAKSVAFAPEVTAVLFCRRNFYCGALLVEPGLSDFRERTIVLSTMVVF